MIQTAITIRVNVEDVFPELADLDKFTRARTLYLMMENANRSFALAGKAGLLPEDLAWQMRISERQARLLMVLLIAKGWISIPQPVVDPPSGFRFAGPSRPWEGFRPAGPSKLDA